MLYFITDAHRHIEFAGAAISAAGVVQDLVILSGATYFFRIPKNVRSLDPSLWGSSGASTVGGGVDDDMLDAVESSR